MKTLADFKKLLVPGLVFHCENYARPETTGSRKVIEVHKHGFYYMRLDQDMPLYSKFTSKNRIFKGTTVTFLKETGEQRYTFVFKKGGKKHGNTTKVSSSQRRGN